MRSRIRRALLAVGVVVLALVLSSPLLLRLAEEKMIETGPNGPETPATVGLAFQRLSIASGPRLLDAYLVPAPSDCQPRVALLVFHGVGETISNWVQAQRILHDQCISSLVFDYSGNGNSTGPGTAKHLDEDAIAAYGVFVSRFAPNHRLCVLGFSMGNAPMLEVFSQFQPPPTCVVVTAAFSSGRESAQYHWRVPAFLINLLPDQWDNVRNVRQVHSRLLVLHSDADSVHPVWMGERIFQAAQPPKRLVIVRGLPHNGSYHNPGTQWWGEILQFLKS